VGAASFGGQELVVEGGVVGDQDAAAEQRRQALGDVGVAGLAGQHGWGHAVDVGRARIDAGVDQGVHRVLDRSVSGDG
jgi:hypothetical protein